MQNRHTIYKDTVNSFRSWPIWLRLGIWDVRRRYRRTSLGVAWILVQLAVTIIVIGVVYGTLLETDLTSFLPSLAIGLVIWNYLTSSIVSGGIAFISSEGYIKQIGLPIFVYVLRFFVSEGIIGFFNFLAFIFIAIYFKVRFQPGAFWAALGIGILMVDSLLLISIFAYINARFRDAAHIASIGMQILFYVTPIIWPAELLKGRAENLAWVVDLNPFYHLIEIVRRPLLLSEPATISNYINSLLFSVGLVIVAVLVIKKYQHRVVYFL